MTNQNQPSEVKEGGALENAVQHIRDLLAFSEQMITAWPDAEITVERRKNVDHLRTVLDALAARPPSMERGEVEGLRDVFERPFDGEDDPRLQMARVLTRREAEAVLEHRGDLVEALAAAPSPAPSAVPLTPENIALANEAARPLQEAYARGYRAKEEEIENDLSPSAVEMAGVDREAIARIISPGNFSLRQGRKRPRQDRENERQQALAKADAILALATASREKGAAE